MSRLVVLAALASWVGCTLLLAEIRWFSPRALVDRLWPYVPGGWARGARSGTLSVGSLREVLAPIGSAAATWFVDLLGVHDDLATRLARVHSDVDVAVVRARQVGWAVVAFGGAGLVSLVVRPPAGLAALLVLTAPMAAFLLVEHQVTVASQRWQERLLRELPVVSEQVGMLLSTGYSLGGALDRIAARGSGACAADLRRVRTRVAHGVDEGTALREWAELADIAALDRLVSTLALDRDTSDLGGLIAEEARVLRREAHRELRAAIDRRAQQVWVPVTVATLVPGTIFLAVPFLDALRLFGGT
jgi:tight adherence protein C